MIPTFFSLLILLQVFLKSYVTNNGNEKGYCWYLLLPNQYYGGGVVLAMH